MRRVTDRLLERVDMYVHVLDFEDGNGVFATEAAWAEEIPMRKPLPPRTKCARRESLILIKLFGIYARIRLKCNVNSSAIESFMKLYN